MTDDFPSAPPTTPEDLIGPGKRYADLSELCADLWRWHDEAQANKMHAMKVEGLNANLRTAFVKQSMEIDDLRAEIATVHAAAVRAYGVASR